MWKFFIVVLISLLFCECDDSSPRSVDNNISLLPHSIHINDDVQIEFQYNYITKNLERIIYNTNGSILRYDIFSYNEFDDLIKINCFNNDGNMFYEYMFEHKANIIKCLKRENGSNMSFSIELNDREEPITIVHEDSNSSILFYDDKGNIISKNSYNNGILLKQEKYAYDNEIGIFSNLKLPKWITMIDGFFFDKMFFINNCIEHQTDGNLIVNKMFYSKKYPIIIHNEHQIKINYMLY